MPTWERGDLRIHYEEHGAGFPVLLFAPGGMRSSIPFWERQPWNPIDLLSGAFRVIAMDQRNAGRSVGPVHGSDGWGTYTDDHLGLLDHLGIDRCALLGCCIGGPFALSAAVTAPDRVTAMVLMQPIGLSADNLSAFHALYDGWAAELAPTRPEVSDADWAGFRANLYGGDFVFALTREQVAACRTPMLVLRGDDLYHPAPISEEVAAVAPNARLVRSWKKGADAASAQAQVLAFLGAHAG